MDKDGKTVPNLTKDDFSMTKRRRTRWPRSGSPAGSAPITSSSTCRNRKTASWSSFTMPT